MSNENTLRGRIRLPDVFICIIAAAVAFLAVQGAYALPGSYDLTFRGVNPANYVNVPPSVMPCPAGGSAVDPIPGAGFPDSDPSLAPGSLGLGQILPFEMKIVVTGSTSPENGIIKFKTSFERKNNFGFNSIYCAFVDTADPANVGLTGSEKATVALTTISSDEITGTIEVEGLADGKSVVVEIWAVLDDTIPSEANGSIHAKLVSAETASGKDINPGGKAIPISVGDFRQLKADISIQKMDTPDPVELLDTITYTIEAHNNSTNTFANGVVITDALDSHTSFVDVSVNDTLGYPTTCQHKVVVVNDVETDVVTCDVGWLDVQETVFVTITASVNKGTPWGPGGDECTADSAVCNNVEIISINDEVLSNNTDSQATGVEEYAAYGGLVLNKEADKPVVKPGTLVTYSYKVSNPKAYPVSDVKVTDDKCKSVIFVSGDTNADSQLDFGEIWVFTCQSTLSEDTTNTGTVTGTDWATGLPLEASNQAVVDVINPGIELKKTSETPTVTKGGIANYTYVVTNIGDDPIRDVTVDDDVCEAVVLASGDMNENSKLDLEEVWTFTCSQALLVDTTNTAQAEGKDSLTNSVLSNTSTVTVTIDDCPSDPAKTAPGVCGCEVADVDSDSDGTMDCKDQCPGEPDIDSDSDGILDCKDQCPGEPDIDSDTDGIVDCKDQCPGAPDVDSDGDGTLDCKDQCPGAPEIDSDGDGTLDCKDQCPGAPETDSDGDGTLDCKDQCPGTPDIDSDGDGTLDCNDQCPGAPDIDSDGDGTLDCKDQCPGEPDTDSDGDGTLNCKDECPADGGKTQPGICGCGTSDEDLDGNGVFDCIDKQCKNVDVTVDRAAIDIGPEQLAVYGRAAFKKLVKNTRKVDKALSKRLAKSGKRLEPKMQLQIKLANQQLDQLPNVIRICPESPVCKAVDNTQKLIQYQTAVRKLSGIVLRTLNRGTRLAAKSVKSIQKKTRPFGRGVKTTTKDLLGRAAKIPPVQSFCAQ